MEKLRDLARKILNERIYPEDHPESVQAFFQPGVDAPFKKAGPGEFVSNNGLRVGFDNIGGHLSAVIYIDKTKEVLLRLTSAPVKSVQAVLDYAQELGRQFNFTFVDEEHPFDIRTAKSGQTLHFKDWLYKKSKAVYNVANPKSVEDS
jgi:hypothetical protein